MDAATLIRTARLRRGLTQSDLAARVGTSQPVVSAYEHGRRDPSIATLRRLVEGTGERLRLGLAPTDDDLPRLKTSDEHARALVDVLLLADAIPRRHRVDQRPVFPRMDSTGLDPGRSMRRPGQ